MKSVIRFILVRRAKLLAFMHDSALLPNKVHVAVFSLSFALSQRAMATSLSNIFNGWQNTVNAVINLLLLGGMLVGIAACLYGIVNLIKKGMGRGEDIEWSKVMWPIIGGALATILLYVLQAVVEESGGSKSDMGRSR